MSSNPYVVLTIHLFRAQLLAARAVGDTARAEAFESAIRSLLEDTGADFELAPASLSMSLTN